MLIDEIVNYCDEQYQTNKLPFGNCNNCHHPSGKCSGECDTCLSQIHWPQNNGKNRDYDCPNMINYYVCSFSYQYVSEICYALIELKILKGYKELKVLSLGCGACADLMALERMLPGVKIDYCGIDQNKLWESVHDKIKSYCNNTCNIKVDLYNNKDALKFVEEKERKNYDIIIMSYFISHFRITNKENQIKDLYNNLYNNVIKQKNKNKPCFIIINDVNSCNCLRDENEELLTILDNRNKEHKDIKKCFKFPGIKYVYGEPYSQSKTLTFPKNNKKYIHQGECRSAQLLVEVK